MKRPLTVVATALLALAIVPSVALAHHDEPVANDPAAVNNTPVAGSETPPVDTATEDTPTQGDTTQGDPSQGDTSQSSTDTSTTSDSCSGTSCSDTPSCTEKCDDPPPCTDNCNDKPPCTVDCDTDPPCVDCIPEDDPCITDLAACGSDDVVAGEGRGPRTAVLGAGRSLPYTGIGDALLPLLVGAMALIAGVVAYRYANVREAFQSAREVARIRREERNKTGYTHALRNIDADGEARSFWEGRKHSAA